MAQSTEYLDCVNFKVHAATATAYNNVSKQDNFANLCVSLSNCV